AWSRTAPRRRRGRTACRHRHARRCRRGGSGYRAGGRGSGRCRRPRRRSASRRGAGSWSRDRSWSRTHPSWMPCQWFLSREGSGLDVGDLQLGQRLAVTLAAPVAGLVLGPGDRDLRALRGSDDLGADIGGGELVGVAGHGGPVDEQDRPQVDAVTGLALDRVDEDGVADGNLLLAATRANDRVHRWNSLSSSGALSLSDRQAVPVLSGTERPLGGRTEEQEYRAGWPTRKVARSPPPPGCGLRPGAVRPRS